MLYEKKSLNPKIITIIVVVLIVVIAVSGFLLAKSKDEPELTDETTTIENLSSQETTSDIQDDETSATKQNNETAVTKPQNADNTLSANERFYQLQQYNMQRDLPLSYDKNAVYCYRGKTEYGGWVQNADSVENLKVEAYSDVNDISFEYAKPNKFILSICLSENRIASDEDYVYYVRDGILYRNPLEISENNEIKNCYALYYNGEEHLKFTDDKLCDIGQYTNYNFIISEKYIYVFATEHDSSIIIRMYHDGSDQTVIMSDMRNVESVPMYTIGKALYFTYDGNLYCNDGKSPYSGIVCEVGKNVELKEALGNTLYFRSAKIHKSYMLHDSYNQTIYKYIPGSDKLTEHTSAIIDGIGDVFVDDNGAVVFACGDEGGTPTYILKNGNVTDGVVLNMNLPDLFIYKNSVYGIGSDGKTLVLVHKF